MSGKYVEMYVVVLDELSGGGRIVPVTSTVYAASGGGPTIIVWSVIIA
jgi:hypothetical protein